MPTDEEVSARPSEPAHDWVPSPGHALERHERVVISGPMPSRCVTR